MSKKSRDPGFESEIKSSVLTTPYTGRFGGYIVSSTFTLPYSEETSSTGPYYCYRVVSSKLQGLK